MSCSFIGLNVTQGSLRDVRVRQAIAHAVDVSRIAALDKLGREPAGGVLPPGMFGYSPMRKGLTYDPEQSLRLLAEAGFPGGEGLETLRMWQADRGELGRLADELLREDLAAVGIRVEFVYAEWEEFDRRLTDLELPVFGLTWVADLPDPDSFLATLFEGESSSNLFAYESAQVDSMLAIGGRMDGAPARAELYRQVERRILEDVPVVPLFFLANNFAVRTEVQGLFITPFGIGNLALEHVWLKEPPS
jgi:ABC-type transport system substrate-binding protein